jgi:hypothetical protein
MLGRGSWIDGYARGDIVAERLDAIRRRLGFDALSAEKRAELAATLELSIARATQELDGVLALAA